MRKIKKETENSYSGSKKQVTPSVIANKEWNDKFGNLRYVENVLQIHKQSERCE